MTTTVLLVRHGSHDRLGRTLCGRMPGVTLNPQGREEARSLAAALRRQGPLEAIYSSPLERTRETAEAIAAAFGATVTVDDDLNELDFGAWSGVAFDELQADSRWAAWNRHRDQTRPPGGETMLEAQVRITRCLERLHGRHPDATVVVVSHGDLVKTAVAWALGLPLALHARLDIAPASVSRILVGEAEARVLNLNQTYDS